MHTDLRMWVMGLVASVAGVAGAQDVTLELIARGYSPSDINDAGSIAFLRTHRHQRTDLIRYSDDLGQERIDAGEVYDADDLRINSSGQISFYVPEILAALRYSDAVGLEELSPPDVVAFSFDLNNHGQVTGYLRPPGERAAPFRYTDGVGIEMIDLGDDVRDARGIAINDSGAVAGVAEPRDTTGQRAFLYCDDGGVRWLGDLGGDSVWVHAMNNRGDVIGFGNVSDGWPYHHYLYTEEDGMVDIGGNAYQEWTTDINENRWIVGHNADRESILWTPDDGWLLLASLLPSGTDAELWMATGINNANQVVGYGQVDGVTGIYRMTIHAVPTTSSSAIVWIALGVFGTRRRR